MKFGPALAALLLIVMVSAVCFGQHENANPGKAVDLKIRLRAGASHEMKMTQTQNINQTVNGQEMKITQNQEMIMGLDVLGVDDNGVMNIEFVYKSMKMVMDGPMGHMEFDTANPKAADANNPAAKMIADIFSCIAGSKFRMKVNPTGETSDIRGLDDMMSKMKEKLGDNPQTQGMGEFFSKMFNEDSIKEMSGNLMATFPKEPVKVGESWYDTIDLNLGFPMSVETTYLLKKRENGLAYIDAIAKMDMGDSEPIKMGPAEMSMQFAGTMNTAMSVDETTGLAQKSSTVMNFSGMMTMAPNAQMPDGMTIPMSVKGNVDVELIK